MKKGNKKVQNVVVESVVTVEVKKGRKVDPTSKRQIRLAELAAKKANGELSKGRPVDPTSKRQVRLAELEAKREAGILKKGRNIDPNSKR